MFLDIRSSHSNTRSGKDLTYTVHVQICFDEKTENNQHFDQIQAKKVNIKKVSAARVKVTHRCLMKYVRFFVPKSSFRAVCFQTLKHLSKKKSPHLMKKEVNRHLEWSVVASFWKQPNQWSAKKKASLGCVRLSFAYGRDKNSATPSIAGFLHYLLVLIGTSPFYASVLGNQTINPNTEEPSFYSPVSDLGCFGHSFRPCRKSPKTSFSSLKSFLNDTHWNECWEIFRPLSPRNVWETIQKIASILVSPKTHNYAVVQK